MIEMELEDKYVWENPDKESDQVRLIKKYLRTSQQKEVLDQLDLSIEDLLNGRFTQSQSKIVKVIFQEWNDKLGTKEFNY
jgi:hypothetical protein